MKVLLIGDYSGLHMELAKGLAELGHETTLLSDGDGWKQITGSSLSFKQGGWRITRFLNSIRGLFKHRAVIGENDIVQFIAPDICHPVFIKFISAMNIKSSVLAAGTDALALLEFIKQDYSPLQAELKACNYGLLSKLNLKSIKRVREIVANRDFVITTTPTYHKAYQWSTNVFGPIPMPVHICEHPYVENKLSTKLRIFHGISRSAFKGSNLIVEAMQIIAERYPDQVEIDIVERLPLAEYMKRMSTANVVIDQAYSKGYGMNALYAMARGKVVLSGCSPDLVEYYGMDECPVVNIDPSVEHIASMLQQAVEAYFRNPQKLVEMGFNIRKFVEANHCSRRVAQRYMDVWTQKI